MRHLQRVAVALDAARDVARLADGELALDELALGVEEDEIEPAGVVLGLHLVGRARVAARRRGLCFRTRTLSVAIEPGTASATVGSARRSMTPLGRCHNRSSTRGSTTPGGRVRHFFNSTIRRGPMPVSDCSEAKRGVSSMGRMGDAGSK